MTLRTTRTVRPAAALAVLLVAAAPVAAQPEAPAALPVAGLIETAILYPGAIRLKAKLDTGARTSSLDVDGYRLYAKGGRDMVEFQVARADGTRVTMRRPLVRIARVKRRDEGTPMSRPVVMLTVCIGNAVRRTEVNLQDRSNFLYPLLVGRRFLIGAFVVDPGRRNVLVPDCPPPDNETAR